MAPKKYSRHQQLVVSFCNFSHFIFFFSDLPNLIFSQFFDPGSAEGRKKFQRSWIFKTKLIFGCWNFFSPVVNYFEWHQLKKEVLCGQQCSQKFFALLHCSRTSGWVGEVLLSLEFKILSAWDSNRGPVALIQMSGLLTLQPDKKLF